MIHITNDFNKTDGEIAVGNNCFCSSVSLFEPYFLLPISMLTVSSPDGAPTSCQYLVVPPRCLLLKVHLGPL
jgi:hypothetical protein